MSSQTFGIFDDRTVQILTLASKKQVREAAELTRSALLSEPGFEQQTLMLIQQFRQRGHLTEATLLAESLFAASGRPPAWRVILAALYLDADRDGECIALLEGQADLPRQSWRLLGQALMIRHHIQDALGVLKVAFHVDPGSAETLGLLVRCHCLRGGFASARDLLDVSRTALGKAVDHCLAEAHLLHSEGNLDGASKLLDPLCTSSAKPEVVLEAAALQIANGQAEHAAELLNGVFRHPASPRYWCPAAELLIRTGRLDEATTHLQQLLNLFPYSARTHYLLASAAVLGGDYRMAVEHHAAACALAPDRADLFFDHAVCLQEVAPFQADRRQLDLKTLELLEHCVKLKHCPPEAIVELDCFKRAHCDWNGLDSLAPRVVKAARASGARMISVLANEAMTLADLLAAAQSASARSLHANEISSDANNNAVKTGTSCGSQRLRLGFLSSDFCDHPTAWLIAGLIEQLDRNTFEVIAYSNSANDGSAIRQRLVSGFDRFVEIAPDHTPKQVADMIAQDTVHILIDLKGHTHGTLIDVLAYRPAPVTATYLGFPGTCGHPGVDYVIGDRRVTPLDEANHFSEKIAHLPLSYQPTDDKRKRPESVSSRIEHGLPADAVVLCCFNQHFKITPSMFELWCTILQQHANTVIWLASGHTDAEERLKAYVQKRGVDAERLVFAPRLPQEAHLERVQLADLMLDTTPYNAHTTASDALWMGVPVLTLRGETFASRVAAGLLDALDLSELVTTTEPEYLSLALELIDNPDKLLVLRQKLRRTLAAGPEVFDSNRQARDFGRLMQRIWTRHAEGKPPTHISLE